MLSEWQKLAKTIRILLWIAAVTVPIAYGWKALRVSGCAEELIGLGVPYVGIELAMENCLKYGLMPEGR